MKLQNLLMCCTLATPFMLDATGTRLKTASGLEYEVLKAAPAGAKTPKNGQRVSVHYSGWLNKNGKPADESKPFDSSRKRGQKFEFYLGKGQVIAGWDEMIGLMQIGQAVRVYIPAKLAYGTRGAGTVIPGNADLIFDIELFDAK